MKFKNSRKPNFTEKLGVDMFWKFRANNFLIFMYT